MDLYQRLGIKRGASEAEVKKAYRSLAKQLHPDRNKDNPQAAKRFGEITNAYDILSDKDKRARYDRGEIDEDGNPKSPFGGGGFGGGSAAAAGRGPGAAAGSKDFPAGSTPAARPISATCSKGCSARAGARRGGGGFGGRARPRAEEGRRRRLSPEGAVHRRRDAEAAAGHARRRQDDRRQVAQGGRGRHPHPPGRAGREGAGRAAAMRSSRSRSRRIRFTSATARTSA